MPPTDFFLFLAEFEEASAGIGAGSLWLPALFAAIPPTIAAVSALLVAMRTRTAVDGRMDALIEVVKASSYAQGEKAEHTRRKISEADAITIAAKKATQDIDVPSPQ